MRTVTATGPRLGVMVTALTYCPLKRSQNQRLLWAWTGKGITWVICYQGHCCPWCVWDINTAHWVPLCSVYHCTTGPILPLWYLLGSFWTHLPAVQKLFWDLICLRLLHFGADWRVWILEGSLIPDSRDVTLQTCRFQLQSWHNFYPDIQRGSEALFIGRWIYEPWKQLVRSSGSSGGLARSWKVLCFALGWLLCHRSRTWGNWTWSTSVANNNPLL